MTYNTYKRNFISDVIFEMKFSDNLIDEEKLDLLHDELKTEFKFFENKYTKRLNFDIQSKDKGFSKEQIIASRLFHEEKDIDQSEKIISVDKHNVTFHHKFIKEQYSSFIDFKKYIELIVKSISITYNLKEANYLSLRYINQIQCRGSSDEWDNIIDPSLLNKGISKFGEISRFMHSLHLKKEEFDVIFQFGQFNNEYPNPIARKEFAFDYNCISDDVQNFQDVTDLTEKMNKAIVDLFEKSIGDGLKQSMRSDFDENS